MTVIEAREEKERLKIDIQKLIMRFSLKTGLTVENINVDNHKLERIKEGTPSGKNRFYRHRNKFIKSS